MTTGAVNWADERYARLYRRMGVRWDRLSLAAQGVWCRLCQEVDRAGVLQLDGLGLEAVADALRKPQEWPVIEPALRELEKAGYLELHPDAVVMPEWWVESQNCSASDKARQAKHRETHRDLARRSAAMPTVASTPDGHEESRPVTPSHAELALVTSHAPAKTKAPAQADLLGSKTEAPAAKKPRKEAKPPDPRHVPLREALVRAFGAVTSTPYAFKFGAEDKVLAELLALCDQHKETGGTAAIPEIEQRWRIGLRWRKPMGESPVQNLHELYREWTRCASPNTAPPAGSSVVLSRGNAPRRENFTEGGAQLEGF
jgi:hypothetical protein